LSDLVAEDAVYDSKAMCCFVAEFHADKAIPDETTILHFRHLLKRHQLTEPTFDVVRHLLK